MKRVNTIDLVPGMILAEDIYAINNTLILPKGFCLTDSDITRLEFHSVISVRIEDETPKKQKEEPEQISGIETFPYSKAIRSTPEFHRFKSNFEQNITSLESALNDVVSRNTPVKVQDLLHNTLDLLKTCKTSSDVFNMLHNMRQYDDLTFTHSLNVALICNVFAQWLHFTEEERELATMCGLLHDIGKLAIPEEIVKKPDKLTDEEYHIIKTHTTEGYNILKNQDINEHIKNAALMHHERCDGGGYPQGLFANDIDKFAKVVSIADVYDAMTAARVYRGPLCPFTVIEIFEKEGLQRYDAQYIMTFLENISLTYIHNHVRLNNGQIGQIVFINKEKFSRPMILTDEGFIDLSKRMDLSITEIL